MRGGKRVLAIVRALQFVLETDQVLFASFAPRKLKRALAKSAELVSASLPTFCGLDLAPVLKLIAALTMVGVLLGAIIMPQNSLLSDAESTLCGTRRVHLLLRSRRPPLRTISACAGGSVNWAWAADMFGQPKWVDLSDAVGDWTDAYGIDPLQELEWTAPADAMMLSFYAQFVAAVLALGTNVARPSAGLMSDTDAIACSLSWSKAQDRNVSDALLLSSCLPKDSVVSSKEQAAAHSAFTVSDLVREAEVTYDCRDMLGAGSFTALYETAYLTVLVQALPATSSCAGGCPFGRPLCKDTNGTLGCVRPTCDDFKLLCNTNSGVGALARFLCSVTCGCDSITSSLLWIGPNSGCLPECREAAVSVAENASCSDAQPGSAELAALVEYSRAFDSNFAGTSYGEAYTTASDRAELGCFALNFEDSWQLCDHEHWSAAAEAKSLVPFCPVSCGCIGDPSGPVKRGCPSTCSAPEPPKLRDLSDAQLALANDEIATQNMEWGYEDPLYPASCLNVSATDCDPLDTVWYRHPCPVACGIDPSAAGTSSARRRAPAAATRRCAI